MTRKEVIEVLTRDLDYWTKKSRIEKLDLLMQQIPQCSTIKELSEKCNLSYLSVLRYMSLFKTLGLVRTRRGGKAYEYDKEFFCGKGE